MTSKPRLHAFLGTRARPRRVTAPMQMPDGTLLAREKGTPQGSLCAAPHNDPYEQRLVMHSVDPSGLVRAVSGAERCT
jgi:hypothetical protein